MEKLQGRKLEALTEGRPALERELQKVLEVWRLPASTGEVRTIEKTFLLLAKYKPDRLGSFYKVILSTPPRAGVDKVTTWLFNADCLPVGNAGGRPLKYGEDARKRAQNLRPDGFSIRAIAREMDCSTCTVQRLLKGVGANGKEPKG